MNLLKWEGNKINISPEAYAIKAFRNIWNADRSQNKEKAIMILGTLYFMYDPRSEYQYETEDVDRLNKIKEETGLGSNWKPDKLFEVAVPIYKSLTITTSARTLQNNRETLDKVDKYLKDIEINADNLKDVLDALSRKNKLAVEISNAEKTIYKDVEEYSAKMRGKGTQTIGDEGIASLFKGEE